MTTEELLQKATPRPWVGRAYPNARGEVENIKIWAESEFHGNLVCAMAAKTPAAVQGNEAFANAELIARAVNSFEAAKKALEGTLFYLKGRAPVEYSEVKRALALMEGKQ